MIDALTHIHICRLKRSLTNKRFTKTHGYWQDCDYSNKELVAVVNSELANNLGNLLLRVTAPKLLPAQCMPPQPSQVRCCGCVTDVRKRDVFVSVRVHFSRITNLVWTVAAQIDPVPSLDADFMAHMV